MGLTSISKRPQGGWGAGNSLFPFHGVCAYCHL